MARAAAEAHDAAMATATATTARLTRGAVSAGARRLALDTLYLALGLPLGILTFTVVVTGWSLALGLAITLVGLPIALLTVGVSRGLAKVERRRAALVLGAPIRAGYRDWRSAESFLKRLGIVLSDVRTWKDLLWHLLLLPIGIAGFTIAVTTWGTTLGLLAMPAWYWSITDPGVDLGLFTIDTWPEAVAASGLGVLSLPLTIALVRGSAAGTAALAKLVLGTERAELEQRVETLTATRAGAVDAAALELQRIERDLHDGAQARMVAVAMDLGMAEQQAREDPQASEELMRRARENARLALVELRELARGMRPGLLAERGLDEAVRSLVARSPLPATADVSLEGRLPAAVETAAYYVVAEALTNCAKHARASSAAVRVSSAGDVLVVEVSDDGRGSADPSGGGLTGLRRRVEALDGVLRVASPAGGPTLVRAELPCAQ
jgi:signal transduction histidine kinase